MAGKHTHTVSDENEKRTLIVIIFTLIMMIIEIMYGYFTHSMALLADGYHMGTHALALGLTYTAYVLAKKFADSDLFINGTDKIGTVAGYTSSIFLGLTGFWIIYEAVGRLLSPLNIEFSQAIIVAVFGLVVNGVCIFIMENKHNHAHHDEHHSEDYNYKAAYYHILADALTSVLAICALVVGKYFNFIYLDSLVGILGGILIINWSYNLLKDTIKILIDMKY